MTQDVINNKCDIITRCLKRIREKTPSTAEILADDVDAQDIISVNLQRAIQAAVDIASHLIS